VERQNFETFLFDGYFLLVDGFIIVYDFKRFFRIVFNCGVNGASDRIFHH